MDVDRSSGRGDDERSGEEERVSPYGDVYVDASIYSGDDDDDDNECAAVWW